MTSGNGGGAQRGVTTASALAGVIGQDVARLLEHDPVVRAGTDAEGIHQARVASRRLRSQLRTFEAAFRGRELRPVVKELGWLGALLGRVRDLDVLGERFEKAASELAATGSGELLRHLRIERQAHYARLIVKMDGGRYRRLLDDVVELSEEPPVRRSCATRSAREVLLPAAAARWHELERGVARLGRGPSDDELHHVRILAKRARYGAEVVSSFGPEELGKVAKRLAKLQKVLGELSDGFRAATWLEALKVESRLDASGAGGDPLVLVERLLAREHGALAVQRATWRDAYVRACGAAAALGWSDAPPAPPHSPGKEGEEVVVRLHALPLSP